MRPIIEQFQERKKEILLGKFFNRDGLILILLPILAVLISFAFRPNFFYSILIFLGLPTVYISLQAPSYIKKVAIFSLIASLPLMIILEYVGGLSLAWAFPPSIFHFELFGRIHLEVLLWAFLNISLVVLFYEYVFDRHKKITIWNNNMWILVRYLLIWASIFAVFFLATNGNIVLPYFYLILGIILFFYPIVMTWLYYPKIIPKILYTTLYFSYLSLLYEITALKLGWWYFPGHNFVGMVSIFGTTFPIEELIFWIILFAPAVACAFEYLDDDHR